MSRLLESRRQRLAPLTGNHKSLNSVAAGLDSPDTQLGFLRSVGDNEAVPPFAPGQRTGVARCWAMEREVLVDAGGVPLPGLLSMPAGAKTMVVFAHGSGSSRLSPRHRRVAEALQNAGLATLLFDLLTPDEEKRRTNVFDIELLAGRMEDATRWLRGEVPADLPVSYFGASTGAGAALVAASRGGSGVASVVSRGGRPDLAGGALEHVLSPTLLIVGGRDPEVLVLNRAAFARLRCERHLEIVPGATHLFEEPGAIESVARLAIDWFDRHR